MVNCAYWQPSDWCLNTAGGRDIQMSAFGAIRLCARHLPFWEEASADKRARLL